MRATIERASDRPGDRAAMPPTLGAPTIRRSSPHLAGRGAGALVRLVMTFLAEWRRRRQRAAAIRKLRAWDDRMLKDIGLTRGEITAAVDGGLYHRRPPRDTATDPAARRSTP